MTSPAALGTHLRQISTRSLAVGVLVALGACGLGRADDQPLGTIVVSSDVNHAAVHQLKKAVGHDPTREELLDLHRVWIEQEILYREGVKQAGGDAGASTREQLIANALASIDQKVKPTSAPDDELRRWFESHRDRYDQPVQYDFEDASPADPRSEAAVRALVDKLNAEASTPPADVRVFKARPESNLRLSYGPEAASALVKAAPGKWSALETRDGWRAMRLTATTPGKPAVLEAQRERIVGEWTAEQVAQKRAAAVKALWQRYKIELAPPFECHADQ